jgi:hypothetical protein
MLKVFVSFPILHVVPDAAHKAYSPVQIEGSVAAQMGFINKKNNDKYFILICLVIYPLSKFYPFSK